MSAAAMKRLSLIVVVLLLTIPAAAMASGDDVLQDCADDTELSRTYSQAEYKSALSKIPADLDEYTDCRDIIRQAQLRRANAASGATNTGGARRTPSKKDRDNVKKKINDRLASSGPLKVGNATIKPGNLNSSSTLPAPLIALLALTLLGAIGASAIAIRRIVLNRRDS